MDFDQQMVEIATSQPLWLHISFALLDLEYDVNRGKGFSTCYLTHKGEALRLLKEQLRNEPFCVDDHVIGCTACLVNCEVCMQDPCY